MSPLATFLTVVVAVGAGAVGGVFFAYSTFTMSALARLAPTDGAAAMQSINREAPRAPLMALMPPPSAETLTGSRTERPLNCSAQVGSSLASPPKPGVSECL